MGRNLAEHYQQTLWTFLAMGASDQQRVIMHPAGPGTSWTNTHTKGTTTTKQPTDAGVQVLATDRARDYRQQGKRYALFTAELIARIQAAPLDAGQNATDKPKQARGMGNRELEPIVATILFTEGRQRNLTAEDVYRIATEAEHKTSLSSVKKTKAWKLYADSIGTSRQKNRPTEYRSDILDELVDENKQVSRTGRKTKPIETDQ
jgi:hypothetical protein